MDLLKLLSQQCGIPVSNLYLCEVSRNNIVRLFDNPNAKGTAIRPSDLLVAYEAASVEKPVYHAWVHHKTFHSGEIFGLPLISSFPINLTCRQVWQHFARLHVDKVQNPKVLEQVLEVVVHDSNGNPREIFPATLSDDDDGGDDPARDSKTAAVPKDLDEPILNFLGPNSFERYLLVWLEWKDVDLEEQDDGKENKHLVDVDSFTKFRDNPRFTEVQKKFGAGPAQRRGVSLDECFQTFIKPERLDERNMWYCSKCKDHVRAMKTMELWRLPDILVVHLKRFEFRNYARRDKLETFVDFPVEGLDMSKHCGSNKHSGFVHEQIPAVYDLFGVINHYGRMGFGHYTAYCREWNECGEMNSWSLFDDSNVSPVVGNKVVSAAAYVLFYRRRPSSL